MFCWDASIISPAWFMSVSRCFGGPATDVWSPVPSTLRPCLMKRRRSCWRQLRGLAAKNSRSCMCMSPDMWASASPDGSMWRRVYCFRASSATYLCTVSGLWIMLALSLEPFSMRFAMLYTGIPRRVYLFLRVSRPCSMSLVFTTSLIIGAVRYSTFSFLSSFHTSDAISSATSGEAPASLIRFSSIFFWSKVSILSLEVLTLSLLAARYLSARSSSTFLRESYTRIFISLVVIPL